MKLNHCYRCQRKHNSVFHGICALCASDVTTPVFGRIEDKTTRHYVASYMVKGYEFLPAADNWFPNFPCNTVAVSSVSCWIGGKVFITACGEDDFGMTATFTGDNARDRTVKVRNTIHEPISQAQLRALGFVEW